MLGSLKESRTQDSSSRNVYVMVHERGLPTVLGVADINDIAC